MRYVALSPLKFKNHEVKAGDTFTVKNEETIRPFIEKGLIKTVTPEQLESFEERVAIMQHDGGLSKEDAEKFAWCFHVCMLTENMSRLCERIKPVPCPRFQREDFERWRRHD